MRRRRHRGVRQAGLAALAWLALALPAGSPAAAPARVVSLNLCTDQLVLALADDEQIAAVSYLARDPRLSYHADRAARLPITSGRGEDVIRLAPDLVLAGTQTTRIAIGLLRRFGFPVIELPPPESFADIRRQLRQTAGLLGHAGRAEPLIAELDARLARLVPAAGSAALYQPNGMTAGRGSLVDAVLTAAGLDNLGARLGIGRFGHLSLERLAMAGPAVLVFSAAAPLRGSLAESLLGHPVVRHLAAQGRAVELPARLWTCGGSFTVEAAERLAAAARG